VIEELVKVLKVNAVGVMGAFAGCHMIFTVNNDVVRIRQPKLLKTLKDNLKNILVDTKGIFMYP
jgi:hypothetical protein